MHPGLLANGLDDARMGMPQGIHADAGHEIQVAAAVGVKYITALAARHHQRIAGVVLKQVFALQVDDGLGGVIHDGGKDAFHLFMIAAGKGGEKLRSGRLSRSLSYR